MKKNKNTPNRVIRREVHPLADPAQTPDLRLSPQERICPAFDEVSIAMYPVADREEMGVQVVDNCAQEHQM